VLTVTTTPERVGNLQDMYRTRLGVKPHLVRPFRYLFTDSETISEYDGDVLTVPFQDGEGRVQELD